MLSTLQPCLPSQPLQDACGGSVCDKVLHSGRGGLPGSLGTRAQSPRRQAYRGAPARGMVGAPASAAVRTADSEEACVRGWCAGSEGRGPQPHAQRADGTHSDRGRVGVGGGCAGPRPAATILPAVQEAEY